MRKEREVLFWLITSAVFGSKLADEQKNNITAELLSSAYDLSVSHSLSHLILPALKTNNIMNVCPEVSEKAKKAVYFASLTTNLRSEELKKIGDVFEENGIEFIPLKGSVLANYYPEQWMRISCDIDVFVKTADFEKAHKLLMNKLGYRSRKVMSHDVLLIAKSGMHVELHYDLIEKKNSAQACYVLGNVWEVSQKKSENSFEYVMSDEMFYFYHIAHMAKHFEEGGCGIRSLLDLYILDKMDKNSEETDKLLIAGGLKKFSDSVSRLAECWFGSGNIEDDEILLNMEDFIIKGKTYGTVQTNATTYAVKNGKSQKIITLLFPEYENMVLLFPVLKKHKFLLPFFWIYRWFKAIFEGRANISVKRLSIASKIDEQNISETEKLLKNLELI